MAPGVPMDELLSKLRSQASSSKKSLTQKEICSTADVDPSLPEDAAIPEGKGQPEITTSQSENLHCNRFRLDFDLLKRYRTDRSISVADVRESESLKLDGPLWAIVKSIEIFKGVCAPVYRWELCDETGVVFGSSIVGDSGVIVGSVVCLTDFSLWKFEGNHLNIVERNVKSVIQ